MLSPHIRILIVVGLIMAGTICCAAQLPDPIFPKGDPKEEEKPKSFQESLEKMRIEKDKKDHDQMVERGVEIVKISEELEKAVDQNGHLTDKDVSKVATVEKLVKKIRSELGGADDDDNDVDDDAEPHPVVGPVGQRVVDPGRPAPSGGDLDRLGARPGDL